MDHDDIGSDDLIGRTVIDLEDRLFDKRFLLFVGCDGINFLFYCCDGIYKYLFYVIDGPSGENRRGMMILKICGGQSSHWKGGVCISPPTPDHRGLWNAGWTS